MSIDECLIFYGVYGLLFADALWILHLLELMRLGSRKLESIPICWVVAFARQARFKNFTEI